MTSTTPAYESLPQRPPRRKKRPRPPPAAADAADDAPSTALAPPSPARDASGAVPLPSCRAPAVRNYPFAYHDHTADIQIHGWGPSLASAFAAAAQGMVHYMTPLDGVECKEGGRAIDVKGHDAQSALFAFLDDVLFAFVADGFVCASFDGVAIDRDAWRVTATGRGEAFDASKHASGTEVKAITYSAMAIAEADDGSADVHVIVDI